MNVIISNKYKEMLDTLEIDVIKTMTGEFDVDDIIATFDNFFYQRMILDITAIKNYHDLKNIQKLSVNLDVSKIILLLDDDEETSSSLYLSRLISMGIYNFTKNKEGILYLLEHPNSYRDVAHIHQLENLTEEVNERVITKSLRIIGFKNVTEHAGSTSLIYMLKKTLQEYYNVVAIEVDKNDFTYFNEENMYSVTSPELPKLLIKYQNSDVILLDLNESDNTDICNDVIYLLEPSIIKLNRLLKANRHVFEKLKNKKIILNKSLLTSKDVLDFEYETKSSIFYNMPPLNERRDNKNYIAPFLAKLGLVRQITEESHTDSKNKLFGLFKF